MRRIRISSLLLLLMFALSISANQVVLAEPADDPAVMAELEGIAQEISESTMSPFCPGRTISACPSDQARKLRIQILEWLKQGYTPTAVRNQLLTIYGTDVMGTPKAEGFGLMAWIMPSIFVVVCFLVVFLVLRSFKRQADEEEDPTISENMEARIAEELKARR